MKKGLCLALALVCVLALAACGGGGRTASSGGESGGGGNDTPTGQKLVFGSMPTDLAVAAVYAMENGFFADEGLEVEFVMFSTGVPINEAMAAGELDVAVSGMASVYSLAVGDYVWIGETCTSPYNAIFVREDNAILEHQGELADYPGVYGSAETVRGQTFLGPLGTTAHYMTSTYCGLFGLDQTQYTMVSMEYAPALQAFEAGEGDVLPANGNFAFMAEDKGYIPVATMEEMIGGSINDGIFVSREVLESRRADLVLFLKGLYRAADVLAADPQLRVSYSLDYFTKNGREWTQEQLERSIEYCRLVSSELMSEPGYQLGFGMLVMGEYYVSEGTLADYQLDFVRDGIDASLINDALGLGVQAAS